LLNSANQDLTNAVTELAGEKKGSISTFQSKSTVQSSDEILETSSNLNSSKEKLKQQLKRVFQLFNSSTVAKLTTTSNLGSI
jgi:DNA integrity scanning protein DisA with diadenylate cyclase activity